MATEWFVRRNDKTAGPFSSQQLRQLAAAGRLTRADQIRKGTSGTFVPAGRAKGLFGDLPVPVQLGVGKTAGQPPQPQVTTTTSETTPARKSNSYLLIARSGVFLAIIASAVAGWRFMTPLLMHLSAGVDDPVTQADATLQDPDKELITGKSSGRAVDQASKPSLASDVSNAFMVPYVAAPSHTITTLGRPHIEQVSSHGRYAVIYGEYRDSAMKSESPAKRSPLRLWDLETCSIVPLPIALRDCRVSPDETLIAGIFDESLVVIALQESPSVQSQRKLMFSHNIQPSAKAFDISWCPDSKHVLVTWQAGCQALGWGMGYRWLPNKTRSERSSWITDEEWSVRIPKQDLVPVKFIGEVFDCTNNDASVVLAVPPQDTKDVSRDAERHVISPDGSTMVWGIDQGMRGAGSVKQKSRFFDLETGQQVYLGHAMLGFSPKGTYFLTIDTSPPVGSEVSNQADAVTVWDARTREEVATIPIERTDGGFDLCCTMDERFLFVADQESHMGEQRAFALPSGEFAGKHGYLAGRHARPIGYRRGWEAVDTPKGPNEIWSADGSAPAFVIGTSDLRQREAVCAADGLVVVATSTPGDSRGESDKVVEIWNLKSAKETIPLVSFRQQHMDAAPARPLEQHFNLTQDEQRAGWLLPAGYVTVAPKISKEQIALLKNGMRREDVQDLLGGVSHKVLLKHSRYDTKDTTLGATWIFDWIDVYAGQEPQSSLWLHFRKDAELTYGGGTLVEIQAEGFD